MSNRFLPSAAMSLVVALVCAGPALAENLALVIGNSAYDETTNLRDARLVMDLEQALNTAGYRVRMAENATRDDLRMILGEFGDAASEADRLIVVFAGHVLNNGSDSFLTPTDLNAPKPITISLQAPALSSLLTIAAEHAGGAGIFLGFDDSDGGFFGGGAGFGGIEGLTPGLAPVDVPQGVLLASGPPGALIDALQDGFLQVGTPTATVVRGLGDDVRVAGYISQFSTLAPGGTVVEAEEPAGDPDQRRQAYWDVARSQDTVASYQDFLSRYPTGSFSDLARDRVAEMQESDTATRAGDFRRAESDLRLTVADRRQIQRDLTILEHDPRGVDGVFGPATRSAIESWQAANDLDKTGYVTRRQLELLREQAQVRGEELAAEAAKKAEAERLADVRFWNQTGRSGQEADLRIYLRSYPDGVYAEEARAQLDVIESARVEASQGAERTAWRTAEAANSIKAYEGYLREYPKGLFADTARERIEDLRRTAADRERLAAAKSEEDRMKLGTDAWELIERKLDQQGLKPGRVDGKPTADTRKAIRRYQRNAGLPVTGYIDRRTLSRLILTIRF